MLRALALLVLTVVAAPALGSEPTRFGGDTASALIGVREAYIKAHGDESVAAIDIQGLRRTHPIVIEQFIHIRRGDRLSACDVLALYERLYRLAIFSSVDVELVHGDAGVTIVVRIAEKWTLYPVPLLWLFQGTEVVGVVLAEANAFGYNKGLALGGVYSNRGWYTIAAYVDPNIAFTDFWGHLEGFAGSGLIENDAPNGDVAQSFDLARVDVQYQIGYTFWDRLSPTLTGAFRWGHVEDVHVAGAAPPQNVTLIDQGFKLIYSDQKYRFYYDEGLRAAAEYQHGFSVSGGTPDYDGVILDATYEHGVFGASSVLASFHATVANFPVVFEDRLGGLDGSRTLPGGGTIAADRYFSATLSFQTPIWVTSVGTLTNLVFLEAGQYARNEDPVTSYGGPGTGFRFYLRNVSIPAVGVDIGYEVNSERLSFSVVVGYRPAR